MEKRHVVSLSGGRTSGYMAKLIKGLYPNNSSFVFMDTCAEHPKTYDFIKNLDKNFGFDVVCLRAVINNELGVGNDRDWETKELLFGYNPLISFAI